MMAVSQLCVHACTAHTLAYGYVWWICTHTHTDIWWLPHTRASMHTHNQLISFILVNVCHCCQLGVGGGKGDWADIFSLLVGKEKSKREEPCVCFAYPFGIYLFTTSGRTHCITPAAGDTERLVEMIGLSLTTFPASCDAY